MFNNDNEVQPFDHANARALTIAIYRNIPMMRYITQIATRAISGDDIPEITYETLNTLQVRNILAMIERTSMDMLTPYEHPFLLKNLVDANAILRQREGYDSCQIAKYLFELERAIIVDMAVRLHR